MISYMSRKVGASFAAAREDIAAQIRQKLQNVIARP